MRSDTARTANRTVPQLAIALAAAALAADGVMAQQLTQPVFRVANAGEPAATTQAPRPAAQALAVTTPRVDPAVTPVAAQAPAATTPFDLEQRPGEHPLMPCLRLAKQALVDMDQRIQDYSATFVKEERISGELGPPQKINMRVRQQPFSVYMKFITPTPGQEALYVDSQNGNKLVAMGSGWKRRFGKINLDPNGAMAMRGQRYPITKCGIRNLTAELVEIAEQDIKYGECTVRHGPAKIDGREATMIESTHPIARRNFRYHKAQIFIDNQLRVPIAYQAFSWPQTEGGQPILEEKYIYTNLKLNNGYTDADFSPEGPNMFK